MRAICLLGLCVLLASAALGRPADKLELSLTLIRGDRGTVPHETAYKVIIIDDQAVYDVSFSGNSDPSAQPVHKTVTLTNDDMNSIRRIVSQRNWFPAEKREFTRAGATDYFSIMISAGGEKSGSSILLNGTPRNPVLTLDDTYRFSDQLIAEVFRILHDHDPDISPADVVD